MEVGVPNVGGPGDLDQTLEIVSLENPTAHFLIWNFGDGQFIEKN